MARNRCGISAFYLFFGQSYIVTSLYNKFIQRMIELQPLLSTCPSAFIHPAVRGRGLICAALWSPAPICGNGTETCYLALRGRLDMELFIGPTLPRLLGAGFIIAPSTFGRQYLRLVSCATAAAAACLLFQWRWVRGSGDLSSSQGLLDKEPYTSPSSAPSEIRTASRRRGRPENK